jgi:methylase of polypeptide subunit release factors
MTEVRALLDLDDAARLRDALGSADFTVPGIAERVGPAAVAGVRRRDFRALLRATADRDRLGTLLRLFAADQTEARVDVEAALAPLSVETALATGLVEPHGGGLRAGIDLDVYRPDESGPDWWVLSDLDADARPGVLRPDHVLGIGSAATTLAGATIRSPVESALDIGTGCGVQALHLGTHARSVTATDVSLRSLRLAATTAALNGLRWELLAGDLLKPVAGRRFDLVVSNPPFVVGPRSTRYAYRDSGRVGDAMCAELAAGAPDVLTEGGVLQFLANWLHLSGEDWRDRVGRWVEGTGCDAWIIQREVTAPVEYVDLWLRDASEPPDAGRAEAWRDWFETNKVEAVGFGVVTMRRSDRADPVVRIEEARQPIDPPLGTHVVAWLERQDWLAAHPGGAVLDVSYRRPDGLKLTQEAQHDGDEWAVSRQILALPDGLRWAEEVDPVTVALVGGSDGRRRLRDQLGVLAAAFDAPEESLLANAVPVVRHLVERGFLEVA